MSENPVPAAFLANRRNPADAPEMERDSGTGQFTKQKGKATNLSKLCREILEQPEYIAKIKEQARHGVGTAPDQLPPTTHKLLVERGYGLPPKAKEDDDAEREKMRALREGAKLWLNEHADEAKIIDISLHQAAKQLKAPEKKGDDDPAP